MYIERGRMYLDIYHGHFYLFGIGTDLEAIQSLYFLGAIKALTSQLLNSKNEMPTVDV